MRVNDKGQFELHEADLDSWRSTFRRVLLNGPPLSGKTTSMKTFPAPRHILVAPGELGHSSLQEDADTKLYYWECDPNGTNVQYLRMWTYLQQLTMDIINGKHGEITTLGIDGLHKLYNVVMMAKGWTPDSDPKEYVKYHAEFEKFVNMTLTSPVSFVVATCYDGNEALEAGSKVTQIFPALPGKQAKQIMGSFPVVFHAERVGDGEKEKFIWRVRSTGKIQGAGLHVPESIRNRFPDELPQDWSKVEAIVNQ